MSQNPPDPQEVVALTTLVDQFIHERLQAKLDKLKPDELEKRQDLLVAHQRTLKSRNSRPEMNKRSQGTAR